MHGKSGLGFASCYWLRRHLAFIDGVRLTSMADTLTMNFSPSGLVEAINGFSFEFKMNGASVLMANTSASSGVDTWHTPTGERDRGGSSWQHVDPPRAS